MIQYLKGFKPYKKEDAEKYKQQGCWAGLTYGDFLDKAANFYPNKEALVDGQTRLTYEQVRQKTNQLAIGFIELGVKPLDCVLVQLPNWAEFIFTVFALEKIGAIPILLLVRHRQIEINQLVELTDAKFWIVAERHHKVDYLQIINAVLKSSPEIEQVVLVRAAQRHC
jgi:2,3-dihydroxybenzoate-AMP ligase